MRLVHRVFVQLSIKLAIVVQRVEFQKSSGVQGVAITTQIGSNLLPAAPDLNFIGHHSGQACLV